MKFKFINLSIDVPEGATVDDVKIAEKKLSDFVTSLGFTGTIGFDVQDDIPASVPVAQKKSASGNTSSAIGSTANVSVKAEAPAPAIDSSAASDFFSALTAAELQAVASPLLQVLANIRDGDGSVLSVEGQGVILEGDIVSILPTLQKIGVAATAQFFIDQVNAFIAAHTAPVPAPAAPPAPPAPAAKNGLRS